MLASRSLVCFFLSWLASEVKAEKRSYMTYDMSTICKSMASHKFKIKMHHSSSGSTGVLMASDYLYHDREAECVAKIIPPRGHAVTYHFEEVHLRRDANNDCRDYVKIYNETSSSDATSPLCRDCCQFVSTERICEGHCGQEAEGRVCERFCDANDTFPRTGTGLSLAVHYRTRCFTCTRRKEHVGFVMVFTAYKLNVGQDTSCVLQSEFQCDNGRCVWAGLTCDGYNNCGDGSDENKSGNSRCAEFPDPVKALIVASAVIVTVLLGVLLAYLPRMSLAELLRKKRKPVFHLPQRHPKKSSSASLISKKSSHNRSVTFQTLPQIRESSICDSEDGHAHSTIAEDENELDAIETISEGVVCNFTSYSLTETERHSCSKEERREGSDCSGD